LNNVIEALEQRGLILAVMEISSIRPLAEKECGQVWRLILSPEEISCLNGMKVMKRRCDFLSGRIAGKRAVRRFMKMKRIPGSDRADPGFQDIDIRRTGTGAPRVYLNNSPGGMGISISHSPFYAASAVCSGAQYAGIGIDIEKIEPRHESLLHVAFRPSEIRALQRGSRQNPGAPPEQVTRYWSLKEAVLKSMGIGLNVDLKDIEISENDSGAVRVACENEVKERLSRLGNHYIDAASYLVGDHVLSVAMLVRGD